MNESNITSLTKIASKYISTTNFASPSTKQENARRNRDKKGGGKQIYMEQKFCRF